MRNSTIRGLAVLAMLMATIPLCAQTSAPVRKKATVAERQSSVQQAEAAIEKKDFTTAENLLSDATKSDPKNYQAWFYLGYVYNATDRKPLAIDAYRKAVALSPALLESNLNLGILLVGEGNPEAAKYLTAAMQAKPKPEQLKLIGAAWLKLADNIEKTNPTEAIAAYRKGAELSPPDPAPHIEIGRLLEAHKDVAGAEKEYKQALVIDPKNSNALAQLSNLYMRARRLPEAETMLRGFVKLNPANVPGHVQLGRVLSVMNKNDEALTEYQAALQLAPDDPDALREVASMQLAAKKFPDAETSYRKLVAAKPKDAELHRGLATALLHQLKYADAKAELLNVVKLKPDWGEAYGDLALAASNEKDYQLALRALNARAKFLPDSANSVWIHATVLDHLGAKKEASEKYRQFLELAAGKFPDQEFQARHRLIAIDPTYKNK